MGKKFILLSFLLVFANCIFTQPKKMHLNQISQVLKKAKAVISGDDIDFNHKVKIWFYKASNPSLFFYNKTEYVDLIKAIDEYNVDKLDVLLADYTLTIQAKEILLNHAQRVIASLEKEIIVENAPKPAVTQPAQANSAAKNQSLNIAPTVLQPVVDNSPKLSKLAMTIVTVMGWIAYTIEDKKVNHEPDREQNRFEYAFTYNNNTGNYDQEKRYFPVQVPKLENVFDGMKYYRMEEARDEDGHIVYEDKKDSDGNIVYQKEIIIGSRKHLKEISHLRPLLNTFKNPYFLIPLLYFANSELIKRLEYKNKNKKVSVLPKALAIRDLILSAPITKEME